MSTLHLSSKWSTKLLALPESGMGYQVVNVTLRSGIIVERLVISNTEYLEIPDTIKSFTLEDIVDIKLFNTQKGGLTSRSS